MCTRCAQVPLRNILAMLPSCIAVFNIDKVNWLIYLCLENTLISDVYVMYVIINRSNVSLYVIMEENHP